jgi:hypothetical protein
MSISALEFTLHPVSSQEDLYDACAVRAHAYGHHLPEIARQLAEPDATDRHPATTVFICREKASGRAIGTMRVQTGEHGPLMLEHSVVLPTWLAGQRRAEITRLAVRVGADPLTRLCLMKASYLFCLTHRVQQMVIGARKDSLIRNYLRLGFVDVFGDGEMMPLAHTGGLLHRIMRFDVQAAERAWALRRHPLYTFMVGTTHEDLQVLPPLPVEGLLPVAPGRRLPALTPVAP